MTQRRDYKQAAIEQWSPDPCGSSVAEGEPGSKAYFEDLLRLARTTRPGCPRRSTTPASRGLDVLDVGCGQGIDVAHYSTWRGVRSTPVARSAIAYEPPSPT
jgi:2-polyprenyl-3-methyl-5-hydroxy-6-metoxy-1,4-benzoquinol methylase